MEVAKATNLQDVDQIYQITHGIYTNKIVYS